MGETSMWARHIHPVLIFVSAVLAQFPAGTAQAKDNLLSLAGEWATASDRCGKEADRDDNFPMIIDANGENFSFGEAVCKVISVKKHGKLVYEVQSACAFEGEPDFVTYRFELRKNKLIFGDGSFSSEFFSCQSGKVESLKAPQPGDTLVLGRCHMDYCSFTLIKSISEVAQSSNGKLLRIVTDRENIKAPTNDAGDPQYSLVKNPKFDGIVDDKTLVHCSLKKPFIAFYSSEEGKWFAHLLNLPDGVSGYNSSSHSLYWAACHLAIVGADEILDAQKQKWLRIFGYQHAWAERDGGQVTFQNEAEILKFTEPENVVSKIESTKNLNAQSTPLPQSERNDSSSISPQRLNVKQLSGLYALYRMASICQQAGNEFSKTNIADYETVLKRAEKASLLNPGDIKLAWNDSAKSVELMKLLDSSGLRRYCREEVSSIKLFMLPFTDKSPDDKPF